MNFDGTESYCRAVFVSDDVTFADLRLPTDLIDNLGSWGITGPKQLALLVAAYEENSTGDVGC